MENGNRMNERIDNGEELDEEYVECHFCDKRLLKKDAYKFNDLYYCNDNCRRGQYNWERLVENPD